MTVADLLDLLRRYEPDDQVVFLSPDDRPVIIDEVWYSHTKQRVVLDLVEPEEE